MNEILKESRFDFISDPDRAFILAFDAEMARLGYDFGGQIGSGYCWGKYMLIYRKSGVKSDRVYARIYIRETSTVLRLFFTDIDRHRRYIEGAPAYIKEVFAGDQGRCQHDKDDLDGHCKFRKTYTLDGQLIEKCNGIVFEFHDPSVEYIPDYLALFKEFYPKRRAVE